MEGLRVLLVDDDSEFVQVITMRLESHGFVVSKAYSGEEALEKVEDLPQLILLDVMMPGMSGYDVCHTLRQGKKTRHIPIIMLTAKDAKEAKIEGLHIGADDYITKPFEADELFARIEAVMRRTSAMEETPEERERLAGEIKRVIDEELIVSLFQPIYYLKPKKLLGVEVLNRPVIDGYFSNSEVLFDTAFKLGMIFDLEMASHKLAIKKLGDYSADHLIFFNIKPYLIEDVKFKEYADSLIGFYPNPNMVGFELTERTAIKDANAFYQMLKFFKNKGFKISIDDIGSGYASLNSILEIRPDFIKINIRLIN
ncbi:MAG: response regulator, partial [Candidatus Omnitrophota bacterium]